MRSEDEIVKIFTPELISIKIKIWRYSKLYLTRRPFRLFRCNMRQKNATDANGSIVFKTNK